MPTREKRKLSTLLQMLDAKSKTVLEAWHTDINGSSFGNKEQSEAGNFSASQPFSKFSVRRKLKNSNVGGSTWPKTDSVSFDDYHIDNEQEGNKPRNLEEMWFSGNKVNFNTQPSASLQRDILEDSLMNVFGGDVIEDKDYKIRFLSALDGAFANVPSPKQIREQGEKGFNVGQVQPYFEVTGAPHLTRFIFGDKREVDFEYGKVAQSLRRISGWQQTLLDLRPGANRINIVFNIKANLDRVLQQNLLMPSDIYHGSGTIKTLSLEKAIEEGEESNLNDDTFTKLYLKNRSAFERTRKPNGTIGGRPVADLEAPEYAPDGNFTPNDNFKVFDFQEDFDRANTFTQDRGFIDNVAGNVFVGKDSEGRSAVASLLPAVQNDFNDHKNAVAGTQDKTTLMKTFEKADAQAFPFMFETVNRSGSGRTGAEYKQYCYLQATLQSLNESYAPSWSSKHFFGRTEQIHTYTMTDRTIDLGFVVFATEIRRLQNLYERITWLAQQTYASYDDSARIKSGPLIRMTIGDMFSNLTGFIRSLSFDWSYLGPGGKWEITQGLRIPMACSVTMNFTVVHDVMPDRSYAFYPGPLLRDDGLRGKRGKLSTQTEGGPLIPTKARQTQQNTANFLRPDLREEFLDIAYNGQREEQFIDQLDRNKSSGINNGVDNIY